MFVPYTRPKNKSYTNVAHNTRPKDSILLYTFIYKTLEKDSLLKIELYPLSVAPLLSLLISCSWWPTRLHQLGLNCFILMLKQVLVSQEIDYDSSLF